MRFVLVRILNLTIHSTVFGCVPASDSHCCLSHCFFFLRLTPYEWYNPHPCLKGRCNLLINQYSLGNSFWFPVGGFMQQGSTIAPRALSTRCVSGVWLVHAHTNMSAFACLQLFTFTLLSLFCFNYMDIALSWYTLHLRSDLKSHSRSEIGRTLSVCVCFHS